MKREGLKVNRAAAFLMLFLIFWTSSLGGCVKRSLLIRSDPPGATVYFNEREIGTTPLDFDFMWYAEHRLQLEKKGYKPVSEIVRIRAPLFLWIPLDLILELIPYTFWDKRELSYTLVPLEE